MEYEFFKQSVFAKLPVIILQTLKGSNMIAPGKKRRSRIRNPGIMMQHKMKKAHPPHPPEARNNHASQIKKWINTGQALNSTDHYLSVHLSI